jgi:hypothetical protein
MNWFPSRYGPNDEIGAANLLTLEVVRRAVGLVTQGKTYAFLFVLGQPRFTGASQSIVNPVAIR